MHLGLGEMLIVLVIALLVFGPSKVPQLGDALGKGIRNFKKAVDEPDTADGSVPNDSEQAKLAAGTPAHTEAAATTRPVAGR